MINQDGFFVSHTGCAVALPEQNQVDEFIPAYTPSNLVLDPATPMFINPLTMSDEFMEIRYQQKVAFDKIMPIMLQVMDEFEKKFGRKYAPVQFYRCDDAEEVLVTLGSMSGTAEFTVDRLRAQGQKVGLAKIVSFRPFPSSTLRERLAKVPHIGVIERAASFGAGGGPVLAEFRSALANTPAKVSGFVAGLGGRDIQPSTFIDVVNQLRTTEPEVMPKWLNVRPDAMQLREFVQQ
jgi:pyruvate ferredoxin oxidoreductase alpha subunit